MNFGFFHPCLKDKLKKILHLLSNLKDMRIPTEFGQEVQKQLFGS